MPKLHNDIQILLSTVHDGSLRDSESPGPKIESVITEKYFARHDIDASSTVLLRLDYDGDFCTYREVLDDERGAGFAQPQMEGESSLRSLLDRTTFIALLAYPQQAEQPYRQHQALLFQ